MFVPNGYQFESEAEKIAFMQRYSFATIITNNDQQIPLATQLPFVIEQRSGKLVLSAHFSIANEQAKYIEQHTSLIIFTEPHAYISPTHYTKHESVPTWDYIAVHAYGKASLITDEALKLKALEQMINFYEEGYLAQWNSLTDTFKHRMVKGIVAFELEVTDLQGQKKLSQNKSQAERESIIAQLEKSNNTAEHDLAGYIQKTLNDKAKKMQILNSTANDIDQIFGLYKVATDFQKSKFIVQWPQFERTLIEQEIAELRQWKLIIDGQVACVWATTFSDPQIWEDKNDDPAVYIHRIATNPDFRGQNLVTTIVTWAKAYAKENGKKFVRLDTVGENQGLIKHYQKSGFNYLGLFNLKNTDQLPAHYHNAAVTLFELNIDEPQFLNKQV